jgi:preprotein translocase subunit SecY
VSTLKNFLKVKELRNKVLFTLFIIALYRIGTHVPVPGIDTDQLRLLKQNANGNGVLGFLNLFSGGALTQFSVFLLGIMPYITASIIMQLLTVVIPRLEQWSKDGATGQKKITQWTRYLTMGLALMQATGYMFVFKNGGSGIFQRNSDGTAAFDLYPGGRWNIGRVTLGVLAIMAGTALVMWMGELISQRGIGQGMSILIFANVVSRLPYEGSRVFREKGLLIFLVVLAIILAMIVAIIIVENGQRRIPVQFAKRMVGRRMFGGQSTYIPRCSHYFRQLDSQLPGSALLGVANVGAQFRGQVPGSGRFTGLRTDLRHPDRVLRLLLHRHHLRSGATSRPTA